MGDENKIRDAADAVKGVVEAVPVYKDAIQPAARELGVALQTIAKTLHVVVSPAAADLVHIEFTCPLHSGSWCLLRAYGSCLKPTRLVT